jgi:type 1 fimbriae regulatory protein FimB/type 1 fimbriae regulatory protein FimE
MVDSWYGEADVSGTRKRPAAPRKPRNAEVRGREYLTAEEVERLRRSALALGRYPERDAAMILLAFRHGLRVSELVGIRWDQVDFGRKTLKVNRLKGSRNGTHDLGRSELQALKKLERSNGGRSPFVFRNERGGKLSPSGFFKILARAGRNCDPPIACHPHMLRHACGFHLINEGHSTRRVQDHLGHRNIAHTERYTELCPDRSARLWDD